MEHMITVVSLTRCHGKCVVKTALSINLRASGRLMHIKIHFRVLLLMFFSDVEVVWNFQCFFYQKRCM